MWYYYVDNNSWSVIITDNDYSFGSAAYTEHLVKVKANAKFTALRVLAVLAAVIAAVTVCFFLSSIPGLCVLWIAVVAALCCMALAFTNREFEYIVCDGELEISCIYGKRARRRVFNAEIKSAYKIERFRGENSVKNVNSVLYACNADDENAYLLLFPQDNSRQCAVLLSCNEKMIKSLEFYNKTALGFSKKA